MTWRKNAGTDHQWEREAVIAAAAAAASAAEGNGNGSGNGNGVIGVEQRAVALPPPPPAAAAAAPASSPTTAMMEEEEDHGDDNNIMVIGRAQQLQQQQQPQSSSSSSLSPTASATAAVIVAAAAAASIADDNVSQLTLPSQADITNNNNNNNNNNNHHNHNHLNDDNDDASATPTTATAAAAAAAVALTRLRTNVTEVLSDTLQILQGVPPPPRNNNMNNNELDVPEHLIIMSDHDDDHNNNNNNNSSSFRVRRGARNESFDDEGTTESKDPEPLDFIHDDPIQHMTIGRRLAMALSRYPWYNPSVAVQDKEPPLLLSPEEEEEEKKNKNKQNEHEDEKIVVVAPESNGNSAAAAVAATTSLKNHHQNNNNIINNNNMVATSYTARPHHHVGGADPLSLTASTRAPFRPTAPPTVTALEHPSLAKAWAYFEHVTLPRHFLKPRDPNKRKKNIFVRCFRRIFCKAHQQLDRAEPGESSAPTKLYDPIFTPLKQMGDFGLGIGLYFSTLRAMMLLTFFAGLINIPNFKFFAGPHYSSMDADGRRQADVKPLLQGSAICPRGSQLWVPCPDCTIDPNKKRHFIIPKTRLANATVRTINATTLQPQEQVVTFALRNFCFGATLQQGFVNYGTLLFVLVGILWLNYYLQKMEVKFDEDEQTAQDYSMVITNPPPDATDPEEWKNYLEDNFANCHVTVCTVAVDNDLLVRSLIERREKMKRIEMLVEAGTTLDDISLSNIAARTERERRWYHHFLAIFLPGIPELFGRVVVLTAKVQGLAQQEYPASNVFVSFETEAAQRQVLATLSVGALAARRNDGRVLPDPKFLFRGVHVLQVQEAEEPNTIRWQDLNAPWFDRSKEVFWTTVATLCAIALIAFIVQLVNNASTVFAALAIAIFNAVFPVFAKLLTSLESHPAEGHKQTSLYFKIALFRWVNTAIVYTIIRPFTSTLDADKGIIPSIYAQFFAEIVTSNAIQLLDPIGHVQRHLLAPRAKTQDAMNLNMRGQPFELAERYTNMTKILFLAMWYCAIYPAAFFMCSFALLVIYFVDRFSLFRTWKPAPHLGTSISKFSRNYFFSLAVVAMAVVSSYYWSAFPFDNLCPNVVVVDNNNNIINNNNNNINIILTPSNITKLQRLQDNYTFATGLIHSGKIAETTLTYRPCLQDLIRSHRVKVFPFTSKSQLPDSKWMTKAQETVTNVYGWTSVGVVGIVILSFLWRWWESIQGLFHSTYEPCGEDQFINFSDVPSMNTYIPQVASPVYSYPLLATNITGLDTSLLEWTDPDREFEFYDLTKDAERLLRGMDISSKVVFSQVKHWPPPSKKKKSSMLSQQKKKMTSRIHIA